MTNYLELAGSVADLAGQPANSVADWPTVTAAAAELGAPTRTVRRWAAAGRLRAVRVPGPHGEEFRIDPASLASARLLMAGQPAGQVANYPAMTGWPAGCPGVAGSLNTTVAGQVAGQDAAAIAALVAELDHLRAVNAQLVAANADLAAALARAPRPWNATSESASTRVDVSPRRWWWPWRR